MRSLSELLFILAVGIFSAITHAMIKLQTVRDNPEIKQHYSFIDFCILSTIAGFSGLIFFLVASLFFHSVVPIALFTGVGGFLGAEGLRRVTGALQDMLINMISRK